MKQPTLLEIKNLIKIVTDKYVGRDIEKQTLLHMLTEIQITLCKEALVSSWSLPIRGLVLDQSPRTYKLETRFWEDIGIYTNHLPDVTVELPFILEQPMNIKINIGDIYEQHKTDIESELTDYTSNLNW